MVIWLKKMILADRIFFPENDNEGTKRLKSQMAIFSRKITEAGNPQYSAPGSERDDMVMALLLACYVARRRYIRDPNMDGTPAIVTGNYNFHRPRVTARDYFPEIQGNNQIKHWKKL